MRKSEDAKALAKEIEGDWQATLGISYTSSLIAGKQEKDMIMDLMIVLLVIAAVILGEVVLYNLGVMSYVERYRELATLKVLGFQNQQISRLLISQNIWLTFLGMILGLPAGIGTLQFLITALAMAVQHITPVF